MLFTCNLLGRNGRLGNQLFQMAGTIGRAHRSGDATRARFPDWAYREFFSVPDAHFEPLATGEDTIDIGRSYMQDLAEFDSCTDYVRRCFSPSDRSGRLVADVRPGIGPTDVAMHVRRGDFTTRPMTHPVPRVSYYRRAAAMVRDHLPGSVIRVFSDDPDWCEENLGIPDIRVHRPSMDLSREENDVVDLVAMSLCGAHVISNSTYGWWGAWLAEGSHVVHPDPWFGPELAHLAPLRFIPEQWQSLDTNPIGPCRADGLVLEEGPSGLTVTSPSTRRVHHLNAAAAVVFEYCTGDNTEADIAGELSAIAPALDWRSALNELRRIGLVAN